MAGFDKDPRKLSSLATQMNSSGSMLSSLTRAPLPTVTPTGPTPAQPVSYSQLAERADKAIAAVNAPQPGIAFDGRYNTPAHYGATHEAAPGAPAAATVTQVAPPPTATATTQVAATPPVAAPAASSAAPTSLENFMQGGGKTVNLGATPAATVAAPNTAQTLDQLRQLAPQVATVDASVVAPPQVRAGGMISNEVASLINLKNQRRAEGVADQKAQGNQAAVNAANAPQQSAIATMMQQASDPLRALDAAGKKQEIEKGKLSLADQARMAGLKATMIDPSATPEERQAASQALRQLSGKDDEVKIAGFSEPSADGMTVTQNSVVFKNGQAIGTAKELGKAAKAKPLPAGISSSNLISEAKAHYKANPKSKDAILAKLAEYGINDATLD